jgi:hypothetical protein
LECPQCFSHRAGIVASKPPCARCIDCGHTYAIKTVKPQRERGESGSNARGESVSASDATNATNATSATNGSAAEPNEREGESQITRAAKKARNDKRRTLLQNADDNRQLERSSNGEVSIAPINLRDIGTMTAELDDLIASGPNALKSAHRRAAKLAQRFGEDFSEMWCLKTDWLRKLETDIRGRTRARFAMQWRPIFLATLALTHSPIIACKAAKVSQATAYLQKKEDPQFEAQWQAAEAHAVDLLHDVCFKSALEGDLEPVFWQGVKVGHIRKYSDKLRIEMLRAHLPDKFKQPGGQINVNTNVQQNALVVDQGFANAIRDRRKASIARRATAQPALESPQPDVTAVPVPVPVSADAE